MLNLNGLRPLTSGKALVAVIGCAVAIVAAIVGGFTKAGIEESANAQRSKLNSVESEIARRDRMFDIARAYDAQWQQTRLGLHAVSGSHGWVFPPAIESIENQLADALTWGYQAAYGLPPPDDVRRRFDTWAGLIAREEARITTPPSPTERSAKPKEQEEGPATAVGGVSNALSNHMSKYWAQRDVLVKDAGDLAASVRMNEARVRRVESIVVTLQIVGVLIVLLKDLLPSKKEPGAA